ncbi:MAG: T9SS type A sorting domain-containing protein [Flavobacteriales bacterium]|nr:T9SS type A sorting domain-containing protein [Flavobacteriales bacterium]
MQHLRTILSALVKGVTTAAFVLLFGTAMAQCTNNNTLLAGGAITPSCPGTTTVPCITGGQYALVNVTNGRVYTFSTCGAIFDTQITLFNNSGGGSLAYNDDSPYCGGVQSYVSWTATYTGQLRVLVDEYSCSSNTICATLTITCATAPVAMTNNECAGAINLLVLDGCFMQTYTNGTATRSTTGSNPTCGGPFNNANFKDVWFKFTAPANGVVIIESVPGTLQDGVMQLIQGTCSSFSNIECDDDDGVGRMSLIDRRCLTLTPNVQYMLRVWGYAGAVGTFGLCVRGFSGWTIPQEDCAGGMTICGDAQLNNASNYTGCVADLGSGNRGCLNGNERQGTWYYFSPSASGDIGLTITPSGNVDYDFAIWGPLTAVACPPASAPTRCSWAYPPAVAGYPASSSFLTGMRSSAPEPSEPDSGPGVDGFVSPMPVITGEIYVMFIDNFDITGQAFTLNWSLMNGASLDCALLPVEMVDLRAIPWDGEVAVQWSTMSERQSESFIVEHSLDGNSFRPVGTLPAAGFSQTRIEYEWTDRNASPGLNYYRIQQVDEDGTTTPSNIVPAMLLPGSGKLVATPNPAKNEVRIEIPEGGSTAAHVEIFDATGRSVLPSALSFQRTELAVEIPITSFAPGSYHARILGKNGAVLGTARFFKE